MANNQYDNALHQLWLDNGRNLCFTRLIDGKNICEMRTTVLIPLVNDSLRDTMNAMKTAWSIAGLSNHKHLIIWFSGFRPEFTGNRFGVTLLMKRDKQVTYSDTDGSYVSTFYLRLARNPETLGPKYIEFDDDDWDQVITWLQNNYGLGYPYMPQPGGAGRDLRVRQVGRHILIETWTWRDV